MRNILSESQNEMAPGLIIAALVLLSVAGAPAKAAVVSLCNSDVEGGIGAANLEAAVIAGGQIRFECPSGSTILFTRPHVVTRATQIDGGNDVTLDGNKHPMFLVAHGVELRFSDIAIRRGQALLSAGPTLPGGVVFGDGTVELLRTTVSNSLNAFWLEAGAVRIRKSRLVDNDGTSVHASAIEIVDRSEFLTNRGTPVLSTSGSVAISDSQFTGNGTSEFSNCMLTITNSSFNAHVGIGKGGALRINCKASIEKSEFHNNRAVHGAAIYIGADTAEVSLRRLKFVGNVADETGGAIAAIEGSGQPLTLTIRNSVFESNRAVRGGAINLAWGGFLNGAALTFKHNSASQGGAIYVVNAGLHIARGAFIDNDATERGGAVFASQYGVGSVEFANSLFVRNNSDHGGSAFHGDAARFIATTISANSGIAVWPEMAVILPPSPGAEVTTYPIQFSNTILMGGFGSPPCRPAFSMVPYNDQGHNLQFSGSDCGASIPSAYPFLGPFFVPLPWSPALNNGDNAVCRTAPVNGRDIFGIKRPLLDKCAIGAAEGDFPRLFSRWFRLNPERRLFDPRGNKR